ncbi:MAG: carboxymuconolactone decarboxylase family protein [Selenomonadaceae bacterium]|nr:carboxymuconolactone decarboxylase family protein [Selenomonadaceae bacterium]MBR1859404.1 carboxymuconolactone decarboxylase family protein [Selenomonadaceae bacterium]
MKLRKMLTLALLCAGASCFSVASDVSAKDYDRVEVSNKNYERMFGNKKLSIDQTDPEMAATYRRYVYGDNFEQSNALTDRERELVRISALATIGVEDALEHEVEGALKIGVTPLEIRETIYQVTPYIGFAKSMEALETINDVFKKNKIKLPLENQATVTEETRFDKGLEVQVGIFGERIMEMRRNATPDVAHFNDNLAEFCFGDTYTRGVLDLKMREMITMAAIASLGGCEPQLKGHIAGNKSVGNTREQVIGVLTAIHPFIGFPRTLNALACINEFFPAE